MPRLAAVCSWSSRPALLPGSSPGASPDGMSTTSTWWPVRAGGAILVVAATAVLLHAFARFVVEGAGTPAPVAPTQRLVVGGLYRHVRNPMYVAVAATIVGQALRSWASLCSWPTRLRSSPSSPRSSTATRSPYWRRGSAPTTTPTAARCPPGGRACDRGGPSRPRRTPGLSCRSTPASVAVQTWYVDIAGR